MSSWSMSSLIQSHDTATLLLIAVTVVLVAAFVVWLAHVCSDAPA